MSRKLFLAAAALAVACLLPSTALAVDLPTALPAVQRTLVAPASAQQDCTSKPLSGTGVAKTTYTAPMSGFVTVRSAGADSSDWDLGLFDAASGRELSGSQGFGSLEVTQSWVTFGQQLTIQGCRESGDAPSLGVSIRFVDAVRETATKASVVRVDYPSPAIRAWFEANGFDVTHSQRRSYMDVLVPSAREARPAEAGRDPVRDENRRPRGAGARSAQGRRRLQGERRGSGLAAADRPQHLPHAGRLPGRAQEDRRQVPGDRPPGRDRPQVVPGPRDAGRRDRRTTSPRRTTASRSTS